MISLFGIIAISFVGVTAYVPISDEDEINIYEEDLTFEEIIERYKGTVIYVDMWASWCGPCRKQMPYSQKLHKKFKNKPVTFLYISVDEKEKAWKRSIKRQKIVGEHYRMSRANAIKLKEVYPDFDTIPRYFIIDKKGEVREDDAPRPKFASATKLIKKWLRKKDG